MTSFKKLLQPLLQWLAAILLVFYIIIIRLTCTIKIENGHHIKTLQANNKPVVVALWHGRLLLMPLLFSRKSKVKAIISAHRDGQMISKFAGFLGIGAIVGSSTKGAVAALKQAVKLAKSGNIIFITPDGPKGPRMQAQSGAVGIARMAEIQLFPVSISCEKAKIFSSWDRFMLPRPFSTVTIIWGKPQSIEKQANKSQRAEATTQLQQTLTELQAQADQNASFTVEAAK